MDSEWTTPEHALKYLAKIDKFAHRTEGESALLDELPATARRILDLGTGDGRLLALALLKCPDAEGVGIDFSPPMLEAARKRFANDPRVGIEDVDFSRPLPDLGDFDVVCSCFAIHHVEHARKRELYAESFAVLRPGGVFCNLEHVASPTERLHERFLAEFGIAPEEEDPSNKLLDVGTQLDWLRKIGFRDVDCLWKWRELALLAGVKE